MYSYKEDISIKKEGDPNSHPKDRKEKKKTK
jgi:hypothetical protein